MSKRITKGTNATVLTTPLRQLKDFKEKRPMYDFNKERRYRNKSSFPQER